MDSITEAIIGPRIARKKGDFYETNFEGQKRCKPRQCHRGVFAAYDTSFDVSKISAAFGKSCGKKC